MDLLQTCRRDHPSNPSLARKSCSRERGTFVRSPVRLFEGDGEENAPHSPFLHVAKGSPLFRGRPDVVGAERAPCEPWS